MDYTKFEQFVSKSRLDRYLLSSHNSQERALNLYQSNLLVSQAFYPLLNLFEIFLRNSINEKLAIHFLDNAWIINQKAGFMQDPSLGPHFWLLSQVIKAENSTRGTITPGKIVAEQTFGFWTSLFEPRHYRLIAGYVIHCFPHKHAQINRSYIATALKRIREFRNRVYHNEAICFNNITIDFSHANSVRTEMYNLLDWMDPDLNTFVRQFDTVDEAISDAMKI